MERDDNGQTGDEWSAHTHARFFVFNDDAIVSCVEIPSTDGGALLRLLSFVFFSALLFVGL